VNGEHIGGIVGFLKSLAFAIRQINPTKCIIIFDGRGGSVRRKKVFPKYKESRNLIRSLNRMYDFGEDYNEVEAMRYQMMRLTEYFQCIPVQFFMIDAIEADDVISYLSTGALKESIVTIVSTDKDFLQLVDNRVTVWNPVTKKLYTPARMLAEFQMKPENFILFKMIDGDNSDNIPGVKGVGLKTLQKNVPELKETVFDLDGLLEHVKPNEKFHAKLIAHKDILERNFELMDLSKSNLNITGNTKMLITNALEDGHIPKINKVKFIGLLNEDMAMNSLVSNVLDWLNTSFSKLNCNAR